jgi:hypothetical protein
MYQNTIKRKAAELRFDVSNGIRLARARVRPFSPF